MILVLVMENLLVSYVDFMIEIFCFCFNDGVIIIENIMGGIVFYEFFLFGLQFVSGVGVSCFDSFGVGEYFLEVVDVNGCVGSFEYLLLEFLFVQINVLDLLIELSLGEEWVIIIFYLVSMFIFCWLFVYGLSCSDCLELIVSFLFEM